MAGRGSIRWRFVWTTVAPILLPLWFAGHAVVIFYNYAVVGGVVGVDAVVYLEAAHRAIAGADPWTTSGSRFAFAGPPPTLLPYMPLAVLPRSLAIGTVMVAGIGAAIWSIRQLGLPPWWLLFPPLFEALLVGNPDALVLALLLAGDRVAGLAPVLKAYGALPLLFQRRWRALIAGGLISALSAPLWPRFIDRLPEIRAALDAQSEGYSAWGTWFIVPTVVALWALRRHGASWLVVPALWPDTQIHYGAMSLPVIRRYPVAAAIIGLATPLAAPVAVVVMAIQSRWWPPSGLEERP